MSFEKKVVKVNKTKEIWSNCWRMTSHATDQMLIFSTWRRLNLYSFATVWGGVPVIALFGLTYYIPKQQTSLSMIDRLDILLKIA